MLKKRVSICLLATAMLFGCAETPTDVLNTSQDTSTTTIEDTLDSQLDGSIEKVVEKVRNGDYGYVKFADDVQINVPNVDSLSIIELQKESLDFSSYVDISKECFSSSDTLSSKQLYFWKPFTTDYVFDGQGSATYLEPKSLAECTNNTDSGYLMYQDEDAFKMTEYYSSTVKSYSNFQYRYISDTILDLNNVSTSYVDKYNAWESQWHTCSNFTGNGIEVLNSLVTNDTDASSITWELNGTPINMGDSIESIENSIAKNSSYTLDNVSFKVKDVSLCEYSTGQQALYYSIQAYFNNFPLDYNTTNYDATNKCRDSYQGNVISLDGNSIDFYSNPFPVLESVSSVERYENYLSFEKALNIVQDMLSDTVNYSFNEVNLEYSIVLNDDNTITLEPSYCFVMDDPILSTSKVYLWVNAITGEKDSSIYIY